MKKQETILIHNSPCAYQHSVHDYVKDTYEAYNVKTVTCNDIYMSNPLNKDVKLLVLPGISHSNPYHQIEIFSFLPYVENGGNIFAICYATYLFMTKHFNSDGIVIHDGVGRHTPYARSINKTNISSVFNNRLSKESIEKGVQFGDNIFDVLYAGGPGIIKNKYTSNDYTTIAKYQKFFSNQTLPNTFDAVGHIKYGKGNIVLTSPHIEAPIDYMIKGHKYMIKENNKYGFPSKKENLFINTVNSLDKTKMDNNSNPIRKQIYENIFQLTK